MTQTKEQIRKKQRAYRKTPEAKRVRAKQRKRYYESGKGKAYRLVQRLATYGLTLEMYAALETSHAGRCAICGKPEGGRWKRLNVDHDHRQKRARGLLCTNCNQGLGKFGDDPRLLERAAAYLKAHGA